MSKRSNYQLIIDFNDQDDSVVVNLMVWTKRMNPCGSWELDRYWDDSSALKDALSYVRYVAPIQRQPTPYDELYSRPPRN